MRILLINPNTTESVTELVARHVAAIAGDAASIKPVTGAFGARYISRASAAIAGHAALDALARHGAGCDAVYLACFGDPGLLALRELAPVPVVGMAEASCLEAARNGRRFAIVTGGALWGPMLTGVRGRDGPQRPACRDTHGRAHRRRDRGKSRRRTRTARGRLHGLRDAGRRRGRDSRRRGSGRDCRTNPADCTGAAAVFRRSRHPRGGGCRGGALQARNPAGNKQRRAVIRPR